MQSTRAGFMAGFIKNWVRKKRRDRAQCRLVEKILAPAGTASGYIQLAAGHDGDMENERCDELARNCAARKDLPADSGYERSSGPSLFDG